MKLLAFPRISLITTLLLFLLPLLSIAQGGKTDSSFQEIRNDLIFSEAQRIRYSDPDSSIHLLNLSYKHFMGNKDTANAIQTLIELAIINGNQANYVASYNVLWKALLLADDSENQAQKARIYIDIGRYYSFYKRKEDAIKYFQLSLDINKELVKDNQIDKGILVNNYISFASTYRELGESEKGEPYLDSAYMFHKLGVSAWHKNQLEFEKAFIHQQKGNFKEGLDIYQKITPWFAKNIPSYFVLFNTYVGDAYRGLNNLQQSEQYYLKALDVSEEYHSHIDFTPLVYEKLADLYIVVGKHHQAYKNLKKAKELDAQFFDSRSLNNRPLFEIQDAYRQEKEYQKELIQKQRVTELEHNEKVSLLQKIILAGAIIFLCVMGLWYFNYVQSKHKAEKLMLKQKQEMEIQKANELVELKNKELATSALKLIEKDELFSALKSKLKNGNNAIPARELKQIIKSNSLNNARNWKEFEARFISVNESFYQKLYEKYPKLSQGDQKLCALIKLNFSSKEMSKLLGISVESVHTSRYRLRKKLNLSREVNLSNFIAGL